jgi:hypothetical protein
MLIAREHAVVAPDIPTPFAFIEIDRVRRVV